MDLPTKEGGRTREHHDDVRAGGETLRALECAVHQPAARRAREDTLTLGERCRRRIRLEAVDVRELVVPAEYVGRWSAMMRARERGRGSGISMLMAR